MKALSLWQPWAEAIAHGSKQVETRDWGTDYRGPIAIHAAKRWTEEERETAHYFYGQGWTSMVEPARGVVVCVAELVDVRMMTMTSCNLVPRTEYSLGLWEPGRYAWYLENVRRLSHPLPLRGQRKLFELSQVDKSIIERRVRDGK